MMRPRLAAALLCATLGLLAAAPPAVAQNSGKTPDVPMDFDPARPEPVVGWWTNGSELMRLEPNGAYQMWITQDRFQRPAEVGAWRRSNYVYFDLEPYRAKPGTRVKVQLVKEAGETQMTREGMKNFRRLAAPPHVFADDVLGAWTAASEQLLIMDNGRYEYRRLGNSGITQHEGIWRTQDSFVFLAPDSPAVDTIRLQGIRSTEGRMELVTANGRFAQEQADAPIMPTKQAGPKSLPAKPADAPVVPAKQPVTPSVLHGSDGPAKRVLPTPGAPNPPSAIPGSPAGSPPGHAPVPPPAPAPAPAPSTPSAPSTPPPPPAPASPPAPSAPPA